MNKKQIVRDFLDNKKPTRVPAAFWTHFVSFHDHYNGLSDENVFNTVVNGQKRYYDEVKPDFVKIMSDGFFGHPSVCEKLITTKEDLEKVESIGANHEWIEKQVAYVKDICDYIGDDVYKFYNIFSPHQYVRLRFEEYDEDFTKFTRLFKEAPEVMTKAAHSIAEDIKILIKKLFTETSLDGIYYSVQAVQDSYFDHDKHKELVEPFDVMILEEIKKYTDDIILHICGYGKYKNEISWYKDYPVKAFNWAVYSESIGLKDGKKILGDKPVIGGFDNAADSILYNGTDDEIVAEVHRILDEAGVVGVGIGADCTVAQDISVDRLKLIEKTCENYQK